MKKFLCMMLSVCLMASTFICSVYAAGNVTQTVQDFESLTVGEIDVNQLEYSDGYELAKNIILTSNHYVHPSIAENMYGQIGKSMKIRMEGLFNTSETGNANYTAPIKICLPEEAVYGGNSNTYSANLYIPELPENVQMQIGTVYAVNGEEKIKSYSYVNPDGKVYNEKGAEITTWNADNWNTVSVGYQKENKVRAQVNGATYGEMAYASNAEGQKVSGYIRIRLQNINGDTKTSIKEWYLIDDFVKTDESYPVLNEFKTDLTIDDSKTVADAKTHWSLSETGKVVSVAENGVTTLIEEGESVKNVTHIMQKLTNGVARLIPITLTGTISNADEAADEAYFEVDGKNYNIGKLGHFIKVGALRKSLNNHSSNEMIILTKNGVEASDEMLVNKSMVAVFRAPQYNVRYSISPRQFNLVNSSGYADITDGTKINASSSNSVNGIANLWGDGEVNKNINLYKSEFAGIEGYKFEYDGQGTGNHNVGLRTVVNAMDSQIMSGGNKTIVEWAIKPETYAYYSAHFRWLKDDGNMQNEPDMFGIHSEGTSGITFMPNGDIKMGGTGNLASANVNQLQYGEAAIGKYEIGKEYKIQLVLNTPKNGDKCFHVDSIWINGVKCAENKDRRAWESEYTFTSLAEVDFTFFNDSAAQDKSFTVHLGGLNCYSSDYFAPDSYIPATVNLPSGETYKNDAFIGTQSIKTGVKTVGEFLAGLDTDDVCQYVTDAEGRIVADTETLAEGMKLRIASLDGKAEGESYITSFITDFGKLTAEQDSEGMYTISRNVSHYKNDNETMRMYAAIYENEKLVECKVSEEQTLTGYENKNFKLNIKPDDGQSVMLFMWNDEFSPCLDVCTVTDGVVLETNKTNK